MNKLEKDRLIEKFMGWELKWISDGTGRNTKAGWKWVNGSESLHRTSYNNSIFGYTEDWNLLMDALKKFDNRSIQHLGFLSKKVYVDLCDKIENSLTKNFDINETVDALCEGIEWYNSTLN